MTIAPEPLSLRRIYAQSLRILGRDYPLILAIMLPFCGAGLIGAAYLRTLLHGEIALHPTGEVFPWLADTIPFAIADAAVVWVALRRLGGGRGPALGGLAGALTTIGAVMAIDVLEGADSLVELMIPPALSDPLEPFFGLATIILGAVWAALWMPAVAIAVAERAGGPASLGRALDLTIGHLRTLVVFALTLDIATRLLAILLSLALGAAGLGDAPFWVLGVFGLLVLPIEAVAGVSQAVVYWELTRLKTGMSPALAADMFG